MLDTASSASETFNAIAGDYRKTCGTLSAHHIIQGTMRAEIGDPSGLNVIDLATGEGRWARYLKENGAASVLGVDISRNMIKLARDSEKDHPLGVRYVEADAATFTSEQTFDLATAAFLLNYADSAEKLGAFCETARGLLKPGGRFVGINFNMFLDSYGYDDWAPVGRRITGPEHPEEGDAFTVSLDNGNRPDIVFDNYYLKPETYETTFAKAGFSDFEWVDLKVTDEGRAEHGDAFWQPLLDRPQLIGFRATN